MLVTVAFTKADLIDDNIDHVSVSASWMSGTVKENWKGGEREGRRCRVAAARRTAQASLNDTAADDTGRSAPIHTPRQSCSFIPCPQQLARRHCVPVWYPFRFVHKLNTLECDRVVILWMVEKNLLLYGMFLTRKRGGRHGSVVCYLMPKLPWTARTACEACTRPSLVAGSRP